MADVIVVDTDVIINFFRGDFKQNNQFRSFLIDSKFCLSAVSVYELLKGTYSEKQVHQCDQIIQMCKILELSSPIANIAAKIYQHLRKEGQLISNEDILIAATAIYGKYSLLTQNKKDFLRIPQLKLFEF